MNWGAMVASQIAARTAAQNAAKRSRAAQSAKQEPPREAGLSGPTHQGKRRTINDVLSEIRRLDP